MVVPSAVPFFWTAPLGLHYIIFVAHYIAHERGLRQLVAGNTSLSKGQFLRKLKIKRNMMVKHTAFSPSIFEVAKKPPPCSNSYLIKNLFVACSKQCYHAVPNSCLKSSCSSQLYFPLQI